MWRYFFAVEVEVGDRVGGSRQSLSRLRFADHLHQQFLRHQLELLRSRGDTGHAVRPLGGVLPLAVPGPRQPHRRLGRRHFLVDDGHVVVELVRQGVEQLPHQRAIHRQLDGVDQLHAVAAVDHQGLGPALLSKPSLYLVALFHRRQLLLLGSRDILGFPFRVNVDQQTLTFGDQAVVGRAGVRAELVPRPAPGLVVEGIAVDRVGRDVDPSGKPG